jgi:hypothetical protein
VRLLQSDPVMGWNALMKRLNCPQLETVPPHSPREKANFLRPQAEKAPDLMEAPTPP